MKIFDITLPMTPEMPVWPGDPAVVLEKSRSIDAGDHVNVTRFACSVHTGTHVDAPHHFLNDGRTVETLMLEIMVGKALVVQIPQEVDLVTASILDKAPIPVGTERLVIKTRNSIYWQKSEQSFQEEFVGISPDGAEWLVDHSVRLVAIDYLSIAPFKKSSPTHLRLLKAGIIILEGVDLGAVEPGWYEIYCLPLKLIGSDGAPARVVLVK